MLVIQESSDGVYVRKHSNFMVWLNEQLDGYGINTEEERITWFFKQYNIRTDNRHSVFIPGPYYAGRDSFIQFIENEKPCQVISKEVRIIHEVELK